MTFYNEFDHNAAEWMRNLVAAGEISGGIVDERSIKALSGADLAGVRRAHFFAGIGGWDLALKLAGWPEDREVWTGSCPCQSFSSAGKGAGVNDPRHLWPDFFRLIRECRPATVFGEQVAAAIKHGWLDGVFADLEGIGYSCGAVVLGAHSVGAPHIRQRIYWVAHRDDQRRRVEHGEAGVRDGLVVGDGRAADRLGEDPASLGRGRGRDGDSARHDGEVQVTRLCDAGGVGHGHGHEDYAERQAHERRWERLEWDEQTSSEREASDNGVGRSSEVDGLADDDDAGLKERGRGRRKSNGFTIAPSVSPWSDYRIIPCTDGKARRTGSRVFPLAHGIPRGVGQSSAWRKGLARGASRARIGMLKGSGNAIVPELAAEFISAFMASVAIAARPKGGI